MYLMPLMKITWTVIVRAVISCVRIYVGVLEIVCAKYMLQVKVYHAD